MTLPLFDKYPGLRDKIPWMSIGKYPTPVQKMEKLGREAGYDNLWLKRDDLTSDIYGGNKVRKLEFVLADAKAKGRKTLICIGGSGSIRYATACSRRGSDISIFAPGAG